MLGEGAGKVADVVLFASRIHVMSARGKAPSPDTALPDAIAWSAGIVSALGKREDLEPLIGAETRVIDLPDATVVPGLVDSHIHPVFGIDIARGPNLVTCRTIEEVTSVLTDAVAALDNEDWLLAWGLDPNVFGDQDVTNDFLNQIADGRPAFIRLFDAHSALVSHEALRLAGITGQETFEDNSRIELRSDGSSSGYLLEMSAMAPVLEIIPALPFDQQADALYEILHHMARTGFTHGQVQDFAPGSAELLRHLEERRDLPLKLRHSPWCYSGSGRERLSEILAEQGIGGRRWKVEGVKLIIDGTIDNGTAWLYEPDTFGESTTSLWLNPAEYEEAIVFLNDNGIPTTTHAIGDKGVDFVVRTIAGLSEKKAQHRVEHIETVTDEVLKVFARHGISASMQPTHCTHFTQADESDNWSVRLGHERTARGFRWRDLRDAGVTLALGTDWPVAPGDARGVIADAQLRRPAGALDDQPRRIEQALTAYQALEGLTTHAWESVGQSGGTLEVGKPAHITVFDLDPLTAAPDEFAQSRALLTVIDGQTVIEAF